MKGIFDTTTQFLLKEAYENSTARIQKLETDLENYRGTGIALLEANNKLKLAIEALKIYAGMDEIAYMERIPCNHNYDDDIVYPHGQIARDALEQLGVKCEKS